MPSITEWPIIELKTLHATKLRYRIVPLRRLIQTTEIIVATKCQIQRCSSGKMINQWEPTQRGLYKVCDHFAIWLKTAAVHQAPNVLLAAASLIFKFWIRSKTITKTSRLDTQVPFDKKNKQDLQKYKTCLRYYRGYQIVRGGKVSSGRSDWRKVVIHCYQQQALNFCSKLLNGNVHIHLGIFEKIARVITTNAVSRLAKPAMNIIRPNRKFWWTDNNHTI